MGWDGTTGIRRLATGCALAAAAGGLVYAASVRPRMRRWGATDEEVTKTLPGDELPSSMGYRPVSTRAITIDAPPDHVWPWLVQMGSGRAGFYTHEWVERLLFITYADGHSSTRIHPEWQELHVGDRVPYSRFNTVPVTMAEHPRCLIAGEWFVLEPLDGGTRTRLIVRTRGGWLEPLARRCCTTTWRAACCEASNLGRKPRRPLRAVARRQGDETMSVAPAVMAPFPKTTGDRTTPRTA